MWPKPLSESSIFNNAITFYNALVELAQVEDIEGDALLIFRGYLTHVFNETNISKSYYSQVKLILEKLECWTILQSGARGTESIVVLHADPKSAARALPAVAAMPVAMFHGSRARTRIDEPKLTGSLDPAILRQELNNIIRLLGGIDLKDALMNIESRLSVLEKTR